MKKRKNRAKLFIWAVSVCMLVSLLSTEALAAAGNISVSSASGNVGSTVTINCTVSVSGGEIGGADGVLIYSPAALQLTGCSGGASGSSGQVYFSLYADGAGRTSLSFSMTFKILKEGSHAVSVANKEIYDWDGNSIGVSGSGGTITGKAQTTSSGTGSSGTGSSGTGSSGTGSSGTGSSGTGSSGTGSSGTGSSGTGTAASKTDTNSKLASLQIYPGTLSPAFQVNTTSYTVKVTDEYKDVTITAAAQSGKADVRVSGGKNLKVGTNEAKVVVTAESGAVTVYHIKIICEKLERVVIDGAEYTIYEEFPDDQIPQGFKKTTLTFNDRIMTGLAHEKADLKLLCLKNAENGTAYYIYDQETQGFYPFVVIQIAEGRSIIPVPIYETEDTLEKISINFQNRTVEAWKIDSEFSLIPAVNSSGDEVFYKYDSVDRTFQRYSEEVPQPVAEELPEEATPVVAEPTMKERILEEYGWQIIGALGSVILVFMLVLLIVIISLLKKKKSDHVLEAKSIDEKILQMRI